MFFVVLLLLQESIQIAHYYLSLRFFRYVQFLFVAPCIPYDNLHFRNREAARVYREFILDRLQNSSRLCHIPRFAQFVLQSLISTAQQCMIELNTEA